MPFEGNRFPGSGRNSYEQRMDRAVQLLKDARRVTAFSGAGITTESGLSDFRSPGGVWDHHRIVTYQEFLASSEARKEYWMMKSEFYRDFRKARPNQAHLTLAERKRHRTHWQC